MQIDNLSAAGEQSEPGRSTAGHHQHAERSECFDAMKTRADLFKLSPSNPSQMICVCFENN